MRPWWLTLLHEQQQSRFADVDGARASIHLPVSDRLLNRLIAERISPQSSLAGVTVRALEHDRFAVRIRLAKLSFLPAWEIRFEIEQQPRLPHAPLLTLRFASSGSAFVARAIRAFGGLPTWLSARADRLEIDLAGLARRHGFDGVLDVLTGLHIGTVPGRFVIIVDAELPEAGTGDGHGSSQA
jgi:hypothetical protein